MAINVVQIKCPACGADLSVESGREFSFCSYCGTKVMLNNENEYIYRTIDEAKVKEAETNRMIQMKQLEMEEKSSFSRKTLMVVWLGSTAILLIMGVIGFSTGNEGLMLCMLLGMCVGLWGGVGMISGEKKKKVQRVVGANEVVITDAMEGMYETNYNSAVALFRSGGFTNVTAIPLNDLTLFNQKKNGQVETVTINGSEEFEEGDVYPRDANVLITYHSRA